MKAIRTDSRDTALLGRITVGSAGSSVRSGGDPERLQGRRPPRRPRRLLAGATSMGRARRDRPFDQVDAHVGGDPVQPRPQTPRSLEPGQAPARRASIVSWTASSASWIDPSIR